MNKEIHDKLSKVISNLLTCNNENFPMNIKILIKESIDLCKEVKDEIFQDQRHAKLEEIKEKQNNKIRIMVVDDDKVLQKMLKSRLEKRQLVVGSYDNPAKAIDDIETFKPDIILLDILMPELTGFEFIQKLKQKQLDKTPRVIVGTGRNYEQDRLYSLKLGADDYLNKPYDIEELCLRIKNLTK
jgi:CheY-like chemotaxis protein